MDSSIDVDAVNERTQRHLSKAKKFVPVPFTDADLVQYYLCVEYCKKNVSQKETISWM